MKPRIHLLCAIFALVWLAAPASAQVLMRDEQFPSTAAAAEPQEKPGEKKSDAKDEKKDERKKGLKLKPERKVEFTTDEGTWLSLDVSPDGRTLVFELLGDIYSLPIEGGEARRLPISDTEHKDGDTMAFDSQPKFSPDGKWIAFLSDRDGAEQVWISKSDGTEPKRLTNDKTANFLSPAWAPDSKYVIVLKNGSLWMHHIQGGSGINMTAPAVPPAPGAGPTLRQGPVFSADSKYLYFAQRTPGPSFSIYNQLTLDWQIARRDMKSGAVDVLTQAIGGAIRPALSPNGRTLVYASRWETQTGLRIRDLESGADRWLKYPVQRDDMESRGTRDLYPGYAFLPDGREIVVTYGGKIHRVSIETGGVRPIPFTAKVVAELGPLARFQRRVEEGPVRSRMIFDAVQSPDGKRVAFSAMTQLYVMDLPNGKPQRVTSGNAGEYKPAWSPDGQWIAYVTWDQKGDGHLWKKRADGSGQPQQLTKTAAYYVDPAFSPDGSRIVLLRANAWMRTEDPVEFGGRPILFDVVWLPASGGEASLVVPARGLGSPHFSKEHDRVFYYGNEGLLSMRLDGTDRRAHLQITGKPFGGNPQPVPAFDARISPDGRYALANVANQLWVLHVPVVGGPAPSVNVNGPTVPSARLTDLGCDSFAWADGGRTITWVTGSSFFRRSLESVQFEPPKAPEAKETEATNEPAGAEKKEEAKSTPPTKDEPKKPKEMEAGVESFEVVLEFPRHKPEGTVVLRGATVITMKGEEVIPNADLLVKDNRIMAVGPKGKVAIPAGAKIWDAAGRWIVPGFVDTHAHFHLPANGIQEVPNWSYLANLAYGVTTGLDVQTGSTDYFTYTDLVAAGKMMGPRSYSTGPGVFSVYDFQSADEAKFMLEKYKKYYRNENIKSYVVGYRQQRQWVVQAAKELNLTVTTEGALDLKLDLTHAIDGMGGNEHSLPIVPLYNDVVQLFARAKTSYTPTLIVLYGGPWAENYYYQTTEVHDDPKLTRFIPHNSIDRLTRRRPWFRKDEHSFPKTAASAAKIQRAGGLVGVGGHGQLNGLGYHWEMWSLGSEGAMTPREVLQAATLDGATIIGLTQDLGSIEPGKLADFVILNKNPLADIRNTNSIQWVMKNGELFDGDTLDQVWPVQKPLPRLWWQNQRPKLN